jgi:hypothetical protein
VSDGVFVLVDCCKRDLRMAAAKMDDEERAEILAIFARGDRAESSSAAVAASANNNEAAEDDSAPAPVDSPTH